MPNKAHIHTTQYAQEHYLYGSAPVEWPSASLCEFHGASRLGSHTRDVAVATLTDHKAPIATSGTITHWQSTVRSYTDYYPFGMEMAERSGSTFNYRYGFNGMEGDDELKGTGNSLNFGARIYDPRISRWLSVDPDFRIYPDCTPYKSFNNNPLVFVDPGGNTEYVVWTIIDEKSGGSYQVIEVLDANKLERRIHSNSEFYEYGYHHIAHEQTISIDADGNVSLSERTRNNDLTKEAVYTRHPAILISAAQNMVDWIGNSDFEGNGGVQKGGFYFVGEDGGVSPTKFKSIHEAKEINADGLLTAMGGIIKARGLHNVPELVDVVGLGTDFLKQFAQENPEYGKRVKEILDTQGGQVFKCLGGCGKYYNVSGDEIDYDTSSGTVTHEISTHNNLGKQ